MPAAVTGKRPNSVLKPAAPLRRSTRLEKIQKGLLEGSKKSCHPPSPAQRRSIRLKKHYKERTEAITDVTGRNSHPSPQSDIQFPKRKRRQENGHSGCEEPSSKRFRVLDATAATDNSASPPESPCCDPAEPDGACSDAIKHWKSHEYQWPLKIVEHGSKMHGEGPKKRSLSRYTQSARDGQNPWAHSREDEKVMLDYGMVVCSFQDEAAIDDDSKQLCRDLLAGTYELPTDSLFHDDIFADLLRKAQWRNEARLLRDFTPSLVPSAELLCIRGKPELMHITEEVDELWESCNSIYGPRVKPDFAVGLAQPAFTAEEIHKLEISHNADSPTYVTLDMYFPFLVCEVKNSEKSLTEAERQSMQSTSIAIRAMIELYRKVSREHELDQKILGFSIVHDHRSVLIHGHYARITDGKIRYFRHFIQSPNFTTPDGRDRWTTYNFTRTVYDHFVPMHLERIRSVLADLEARADESFTSQVGANSDSQEPGSQEIAMSAQSFQRDGIFKKPSIPSTSMLQVENDKLHKELERQGKEKTEKEKKTEEQIDKLLQQIERQQQEHQHQQQEQQRQQQEQQRQQQEQQQEQQRQLLEQLERQRVESKEQLEQERKASKEREVRLMENMTEMMSRFQQSQGSSARLSS